MSSMPVIEIDYTNHRGERRKRLIVPVGSIRFGSNAFHPKPQCLLRAWDMEKQAWRDFAMADIHEWARDPASAEQIGDRKIAPGLRMKAIEDGLREANSVEWATLATPALQAEIRELMTETPVTPWLMNFLDVNLTDRKLDTE